VCAFDVVCSQDGPGATVWLNEPGLNSCPFSPLLRSSLPTQSSPPLLPSFPTPLTRSPTTRTRIHITPLPSPSLSHTHARAHTLTSSTAHLNRCCHRRFRQ
jgi:hypothetical protein